MKNIEYSLLKETETILPVVLQNKIDALDNYCFGNIDPIEMIEYFYADIWAQICAFSQQDLIGHLILHKRTITFEEKTIIIGGAVGACVRKNMRRQGIGEEMMRIGLKSLVKEGCDVACLTVDPEEGKEAIKLYTKLGYVMMPRPISYEDSNGKIRYDSDSMFIPLGSVEKFNYIMESSETFHYGRGYW
ncbi:MAG: GNAT family N-acetyltransferase [Promethearchaeota archaeon]